LGNLVFFAFRVTSVALHAPRRKRHGFFQAWTSWSPRATVH